MSCFARTPCDHSVCTKHRNDPEGVCGISILVSALLLSKHNTKQIGPSQMLLSIFTCLVDYLSRCLSSARSMLDDAPLILASKALVKYKTPQKLAPQSKGDRPKARPPNLELGFPFVGKVQEVRLLRLVLGQELSEVNLWPFLCSKVRWLSKCSEELSKCSEDLLFELSRC